METSRTMPRSRKRRLIMVYITSDIDVSPLPIQSPKPFQDRIDARHHSGQHGYDDCKDQERKDYRHHDVFNSHYLSTPSRRSMLFCIPPLKCMYISMLMPSPSRPIITNTTCVMLSSIMRTSSASAGSSGL